MNEDIKLSRVACKKDFIDYHFIKGNIYHSVSVDSILMIENNGNWILFSIKNDEFKYLKNYKGFFYDIKIYERIEKLKKLKNYK